MTVLFQPKRIVILTPSVTGTDGISTMTRAVTHAMQRKWGDPFNEITVLALAGTVDEWRAVGWPEVTYHSADRSRMRFAAWGIGATRRSRTATIVLVMHIHLLPVALPLLLCGARIVVFLNGIEVWRSLNRLETWMLRRVWKRIAISSYTATRFTATNPIFAAYEIHVCHLGLPKLDQTSNGHIPREEFVVIVGRMAAEERYKGHDLLLELWPRIRAEIPNATLLVVGDGDDRLRLTAKANSLGVAKHIAFLGRVSDETLTDLYRRCAVFVMPSPHEGFGLVFLEAMRAEAACIGGVGAAAEVIKHGVTGFVVDPQQPENVQDAILQLLRDPERRKQMGAAGAVRFDRYFTAEHFQQRLLALLDLEREGR